MMVMEFGGGGGGWMWLVAWLVYASWGGVRGGR